jgi:hypothetical protein
MKKSGIGIYFIALWFFVAFTFLIYPLTLQIASYRGAGLNLPFLLQGIWLVATIVLVAELVGLVVLHPLPRWLYVIVISIWSAVIVYKVQQEIAGQTLAVNHLLWSLLLLTVNIFSIVYLVRPGFRKMCDQQRGKG